MVSSRWRLCEARAFVFCLNSVLYFVLEARKKARGHSDDDDDNDAVAAVFNVTSIKLRRSQFFSRGNMRTKVVQRQ
jgi:hypothetical protein